MTSVLAERSDPPAIEREQAPARRGGKYLTFRLGNEEYGVAVLKVREIDKLLDITAVPRMPDYMKGVINLRGNVIPVIDLRLKFGLDAVDYSDQTCIIVLDVGKEIGIIVDAVSEVLDIADENIEPPPSVGASADTSFILGMGKIQQAVKILLDVDQVLNDREMMYVETAAAATSGAAPLDVRAQGDDP